MAPYLQNQGSKPEEVLMKRLFKKLEDLMVAITFAESGEVETAIEIIGERPVKTEEPALDVIMESHDASDGA